jgi:thioesterase domain-containing protein
MEELIAGRFIPEPDGDGTLFLTGDRARALTDGRFEFLGRRDDQLKIRGFRVEPGEIAAALLTHAEVGGAHAGLSDGRLVAWVEPKDDDVPAIAALRDHVAGRLPDYMVPARFVVLEELPRTATGKVDRPALPPPPRTTGAGGRLAEGTETLLARLWQQVLGVRGVGPDDDFFALGGHSLLAVRLFAEIEKRFGDEPPFFCVHGLGGNVVSLRGLARRLDSDRPFLGLQSPALRRDRRPPLSIDALADLYVEEVRRERPSGPYLLGGLCFGSLVAFEMARRLRAAGEEVPALALIDPPPVPARGPKKGRGYRRLLFRLAVLGIRRTLFRRTVTYPTVKHVNRILRSRYDPRPYDGPVTLFLSTEYGRDSHRDDAREPAWRKVSTGSFDVRVIPGHHRFLLHEPRVAELARRLTETLRSATL